MDSLTCRPWQSPKPGINNDITSPVIDLATIQLALNLTAKHDLEIAILNITNTFLGCPLHETFYMLLTDGK
jgi:hypothetical protein